MPFSHHSHSGEFCSHAKDTLAQVVTAARDKRMQVFALTEHISRSDLDLYPGEAEIDNEVSLAEKFDNFVTAAKGLKAKFEEEETLRHDTAGMTVLIGFEGEWIRPETGAEVALIKSLMARGDFDFFVGSVHHVHTIPIDFDRALYERAREAAGGSEEKLFAAYFDAQYDMLNALRPKLVAHFDLIRLFSDSPDASPQRWVGVWSRILRNLDVVKGYGGLLEINSAGLRKGLKEPYPQGEICVAWKTMHGGFVMSDDSHGIEQVGACYGQVLSFMEAYELEEIVYLESDEKSGVVERNMLLDDVKRLPFWKAI
ncbi:MAG: histidinolphosphatase [Peltula sp. TS41687]|nr:MAG: histidinolphosphatase [Peltula sp. TS41687]